MKKQFAVTFEVNDGVNMGKFNPECNINGNVWQFEFEGNSRSSEASIIKQLANDMRFHKIKSNMYRVIKVEEITA